MDIDKEIYFSLLIDRSRAQITCLVHKDGGVEVEENDQSTFFRAPLSSEGAVDSTADQIIQYLNMPTLNEQLKKFLLAAYRCFITEDAQLLEINPLFITESGDLIAGDCKLELDDAARFRHPDWKFSQELADTNFVTLDSNGSVATIANGAGLAMATVDAVSAANLTPANFLDIGGGANEASVFAAFERISEYPNIKAILINIFAGITRCDEVAKAIIAAKNKLPNLPPLYIRLAGTNFDDAKALMNEANIPLLASLDKAIDRIREQL